jgi:formylglycine-generating enzyme required for sulfatase activity
MKLRRNTSDRVLRGGSYFFEPKFLRCTDRNWFAPVIGNRVFGFRFVVRGRFR